MKSRKGMTVVEVVVAFTLMSLSFAVGMVGIASGSNYINAGARLKNEGRKNAVVDLQNDSPDSAEITVKDSNGDTKGTFTVSKYEADGFVKYAPKS